ncbi:esterase FE4-like [Vanessa atalanta]|uniref:esterase FE4-like n=1 Tax=Vanessa atalanta TaxID=42275 RepID=UPI001FCDC006|nr:esterase FE4-like [Vanessa atalanta]
MKTYWLVLWSLWAARLVRQPTLPVRVTGGWLRGVVAPDGSHKRYMAVPFATHPVKRFQGPGPEPTWRGVLEAIEENVRCLQRIGKSILIGQEECLIMNIYTPIDATAHSKYPVMVFFHGGGFYEGSGTGFLYGPEYLVTKGIILVVLNYRLQIQGMVCLKIKEAPGNAALKDQLAALKWIQRNIEAFGGDPNSVTISGESAGAASVSFHILSPMSKGLFHRAILQSGSSLDPWALQFRPVYMAGLLTKVMGHATDDLYEIYNILMEKSDEDLIVSRVPRRPGHLIISELLYTPCVEDEIPGVEPFLTEFPYDLLSTGKYNKVPVLIGRTNSEGLLFSNMENDTTLPKIMFEKTLPKNWHVPDESKRKEIGAKLKELYFGDKDISYNTLENLSQLYDEVYFSFGVLQETEFYLNTNDNPVYSYVFSYDGRRNILKFTLDHGLSAAPGATHADDLFYLFQQPLLPSFFERTMIDRVTTLWTNFVKYGDPTPEVTDFLPVKWLPTNKTSPQTFVIDREFSTIPLWPSDSFKYLRDIYSKYRRKTD